MKEEISGNVVEIEKVIRIRGESNLNNVCGRRVGRGQDAEREFTKVGGRKFGCLKAGMGRGCCIG